MRIAQDRARSATIKSRIIIINKSRAPRDENVPAKRADFFNYYNLVYIFVITIRMKFNETKF